MHRIVFGKIILRTAATLTESHIGDMAPSLVGQIGESEAVIVAAVLNRQIRYLLHQSTATRMEAKMKLSIALAALLITGFVTASTEEASAVVLCQYVDYPAGCIVTTGVALRPRPVARPAILPGNTTLSDSLDI
jgi:hypothetical protein